MAGRLTRFMNLEKARSPSETPAHGIANTARFSDEPPAAAPEEAFRAERDAQLVSGVEIDTEGAAGQPFLRCPVCEADNTKYAVRCINCQARLDTDAVHAWNRRLWEERKAAAAQEQAQVAQAAEAQLDPVQLAAQNRQLGEALAREVGMRERARLGFWGGGWSDATPAGMRLLSLIPNETTRFAVAMALVGTFFGAGLVAYLAKHHPVLQTGAALVAVLLFALFTPNFRRGYRWWDWY